MGPRGRRDSWTPDGRVEVMVVVVVRLPGVRWRVLKLCGGLCWYTVCIGSGGRSSGGSWGWQLEVVVVLFWDEMFVIF